jgi:hypothetical protein
MRRPRSITIAAAILGALLLSFPAVSASAAFARNAWIGLDGGHLGDYEWSVKVKRPEGPAGAGPQGALRPCLLVGTKWAPGPGGFSRTQYRACAGREGRLRAGDPPLLRSGGLATRGARAGITAVGLVASPAVRRVRVQLGDGSWKTVRLNRLSRDKASTAKLGRLSYAAFAVRGSWCSERIVTVNAAGDPLWDSGTDEYSCQASG